MTTQTLEYISELADNAPKSHIKSLDDLCSELIDKCHSWTKPDSNHTPARMTQDLFDKKFSARMSQSEKNILKVSLMAKIALITPNLIQNESLPESILSYYPAAFERLSVNLKKVAEKPLDTNYNLFDRIGLLLAINIPCGSKSIDLCSSVPLTSVILSLYRDFSQKPLINYLRYRGLGVWFREHTDVEYLEEFNEEGFEKFYLRIAELLLKRKNVRGLVATSWLYDPQLLDISPRLSYLQLRRLERGAFLMRHRSTEADVRFATIKSQTRRRLYEEGRYKPVSYSLIWGRNEILNWAKRNGIKTECSIP